jgi:hypothetical protein
MSAGDKAAINANGLSNLIIVNGITDQKNCFRIQTNL